VARLCHGLDRQRAVPCIQGLAQSHRHLALDGRAPVAAEGDRGAGRQQAGLEHAAGRRLRHAQQALHRRGGAAHLPADRRAVAARRHQGRHAVLQGVARVEIRRAQRRRHRSDVRRTQVQRLSNPGGSIDHGTRLQGSEGVEGRGGQPSRYRASEHRNFRHPAQAWFMCTAKAFSAPCERGRDRLATS
jgi:hypothetical protein